MEEITQDSLGDAFANMPPAMREQYIKDLENELKRDKALYEGYGDEDYDEEGEEELEEEDDMGYDK